MSHFPLGLFASASVEVFYKLAIARNGTPNQIYNASPFPMAKDFDVSGSDVGAAKGVAFSPNGRFCAFLWPSALTVYNTTTTPWTRMPTPVGTIGSTSSEGKVAFSPDGTRCVVVTSGSPYLTIYNTTVTPWVAITNPTSPPTGNTNGVAFNSTGTRCALSSTTSPYLWYYNTTTTPWTKLTNPSSLPNGAQAVAHSPTFTRAVVVGGSSPFM